MSEELKQENAEVNLSQSQESGIPDNTEVHVIYCGPNLYQHSVFKHEVWIGGYPPRLLNLMKEIPEIARMFVPVREAEEMRRKIRRKGTPEHMWYERLKSLEAKK